MADIDTIISGALGNTRADFSGSGDLAGMYFKGLDQNRKGKDADYTEKMRNLFSDENGGLPRDAQGNIDSGKLYERLMQAGGAPAIEAASKAAETGFQQDRYRNAPAVDSFLRGDQPQQAIISPPSANRIAPAQVAPALARGGLPGQAPSGSSSPAAGPDGSYRGGDNKASLISFLSNNGVPEQDQGSVANILGGQLSQATGRRIDPNAPLDMKDPTTRQVLVNFVRSKQSGGQGAQIVPQQNIDVPQPQAAAPALPAPPPAAPASTSLAPAPPSSASAGPVDPTLGGLIPAGYPDPGAYVRRLEAIAGSGRVLPDQLKILQGRIEAIHKAMEPTPDIKNARAAGMSVKDYLDRNDNATTDRAVLTGSILPKLDKSQDGANAARDDINAIYRSRDQLDAPGGIFSGAGADVQLKLAKVASFLGVPDADKIANTEAFGSAIGARVLSLVKGLGAGAGISNADRDFAAAMAGGNIKLSEPAIRRILDIGETAARAKIDQHNKLSSNTLKSAKALEDYGDVYRVEQPDAYRRRPQGSSAPTTATNAVAGPLQFSSRTDPRLSGAKSGDIIVDENGKKFRVR